MNPEPNKVYELVKKRETSREHMETTRQYPWAIEIEDQK